MQEQQRKVNNYEITRSIQVGNREVVFGVDEAADQPYFCAFCQGNTLFEEYTECIASDDYIGMMEKFAQRVLTQCQQVRSEQEQVTVPREKITPDMCYKNDYGKDIRGKVVAVKLPVLRPEYRSAEHQLIYVTGGNGSYANSRGNACFYINLYSGENGRWERYDIEGEVKPECLPDWAKERLETIRKKEQEKQISK